MEPIAKSNLINMHSNNELPTIHFDCSKCGKAILLLYKTYVRTFGSCVAIFLILLFILFL